MNSLIPFFTSIPDSTRLLTSPNESIHATALSRESQQVKICLEKYFIGPQARVGLLCSTKRKTISGLGGLLMAENIAIPIDAHAPIERNIKIITDADLHALLIDEPLFEQYQERLRVCGESEVVVEGDSKIVIFAKKEQEASMPPQLAYFLYTSGSTGQPKGVMISHSNAWSFINWASSIGNFTSKDVFASIAPFHFDLSIFDLYVAMKHGSSLALFEPAVTKNPQLLASRLAEQKVSVLYATPTLLRSLLHYGKLQRYDHSTLRYILFAGEVFPIADLKQLKAQWPQATFINLYGPTETNVCTHYTIPNEIGERTAPYPIGQACLPDTTKIIGEAKTGELLVSGPTVSPGYWNSPEKNAAAFSTDEQGIRWYKTGDLVKMEDNNYVFVGRKDRMVKRRGYRIELDEIEIALGQHPDLEMVAVVVGEEKNHQPLIKAWYQLKAGAATLNSFQLKTFCSQLLPLYMLPDQFEAIEELPTTSSQKIDYQALKLSSI